MKGAPFMLRVLAGGFATTLVLLLAVTAGWLHGALLPEQTLFSNDGPLGQLLAQCHQLPGRFLGCWLDLNNVGFNGGAAAPSISFGLQWLLGPVWFSKLYAILSLLILGMGAWCFFREMELAGLACVLGALAVVLNATFFSVACWGVGAHDIAAGMSFLALAALADQTSRLRWLRVILGGGALGMAVTEGADVGAILSVYVAAFIAYQACVAPGSRVRNLAAGMMRLVLTAGFAGLLAAQGIHGLFSTSIEGMAQSHQDAQAKAAHWDWATQWSLPKREMLSLVAPGVFGYRMDTPAGGIYWGMMGRSPVWDRYEAAGRQGPPPEDLARYSGGGNYAGDLVVLAALWAAAQSLRRENSSFSLPQRKWLWFWGAVAVVSLLLALGRFAPFYQLAYALPYFSTIRNPTKFLYPFSLALVVLFAYGVDGWWRQYLRPGALVRWDGFGNWWKRAGQFEKNWLGGCALAGVVGLLAWWDYGQHRETLDGYLETAQVNAPVDQVARFSIHQAGWAVMTFLAAGGLMALIFSGAFAGQGAAQGGFWLAVLLVADLGWANQPWIVYWNYPDKYATNPIIDRLRERPYEHRVGMAPLDLPPQLTILTKLYRREWLQHQFPFYSIQSYEMVEMSRMPEDYSAFRSQVYQTNMTGFWFRQARAWQLTACRYFFAPANAAEYLNRQDLFTKDEVRLITQFNILPKPGIQIAIHTDQLTAVPEPNGRFGLFEYTAALPRAKLYSHWEVSTNNAETLTNMFSPAFDPAQDVYVAGGAPNLAAQASEATRSVGSVAITSYAPKDIILDASAAVPSILSLADHFDPNWKVWVDGRPEKVLRCNFFMRGVYLEPGHHQVEFKFQPPVGWLYVSLTAVGISGLLAGWLAKLRRKERAVISELAVPAPAPAPSRESKDALQPASSKPSGRPKLAKRSGKQATTKE